MSSPPGPTRCSAPVFVALSPEHPLAQELAKKDAKLAAFIAECRKTGTAEAEIEKAEKLGYDTGLTAAHPFDRGLEAAGDGGQFRADGLRHRRDLRLPGA